MARRNKKIKVHIGAGTVYLKGYDNLDVPTDEFYFAKARPDLVKENLTTLENYYKDTYYNNYYERFKQKLNKNKLPPPKGAPVKNVKRRKVVIDAIAYASHLPYKPGTIDEILAVQIFEHFGPKEAEDILKHWWELLKKEGKIIIDVPDIKETAVLLAHAETQEEIAWAEKLIYGTRNDNFAYHKVGYWPKKLESMLKKVGFANIKINTFISHTYPTFSMEAIKR